MTTPRSEFETLLHEVSQKLTTDDIEQIMDLLLANELGVAFENLCTQLYERDAVCTKDQIDQITRIGNALKIDSDYWQGLPIR